MNNELKYISSGGKDYPMCLNLNVLCEIQEQYGSLENWSDKIESKGNEPSIGDLLNSFLLFINEGFEVAGIDEKVTKRQVGIILTDFGIENATKKLNELVTASLPESEKN